MMKKLKKGVSTIAMAAVLGTASMTASPQPAEAGFLLATLQVTIAGGIAIFLVGWATGSGILLLLGVDGQLDQDALMKVMAEKYPTLDTQTVSDLARATKEKAASIRPDESGKIMVTFTRDELADILAASNIQNDDPALFDQIVRDFK